MPTVSLTGSDTIEIGGVVLNDFADGDNANLTYPNELMAVKTGKGGNSIYAFNTSGLQNEITLRILRGSDDDKYLDGLMKDMISDPASFTLLDGRMVKRVGDGQGNITSDEYIMDGGVFTKQVEAKSNVEGDTEQAISIYALKFTNSVRAIQ